MSWLGIYGFESRDHLRDGLTLILGNPSYQSDVPAGGSVRSFSGDTNVLQVSASWDHSTDEFWIHIKVKPRSNTDDNDNFIVAWRSGGTNRGWINFQDFTMYPQVYIGGVLQSTAGQGLTLNTWNTLHVHVKIDTIAGFVRTYLNGDLTSPLNTFNGNTDPNTDLSMDGWFWQSNPVGNAPWYIDDLLFMDPTDATGIVDPNNMLNVGIRPHYPTSDGFHTAWTQQGTPGGTNDYEHIDEVVPDDGDYIRATAAAQQSTFGFDDAPADGVVIGARVKARVLRGDTTAGANIRTLGRQGGTTYAGTTQAAPADGDVDEIYDLAPDGSAWDTAKFNGVEWGVEAVT
jgi:hypothetical protein